MNRHIIIRASIAVLWLVIGIISFVKGQTTTGVLGLVMCAAFAYSAFAMTKKK